jgi:hypothetical protein
MRNRTVLRYKPDGNQEHGDSTWKEKMIEWRNMGQGRESQMISRDVCPDRLTKLVVKG